MLLLLTSGCGVTRQQEVKKVETSVATFQERDSLSLGRLLEERQGRRWQLEHIRFRMPDSMRRVYPESVTRIALEEDRMRIDSVVVNNNSVSSGQSDRVVVEERYNKREMMRKGFSLLHGIMLLLFLGGIIKIVNRYIKIRN